jgi:hypothetical protein
MINKIKNKYYKYQRGEFLPVYMDGRLANKREFHIYKAKRAAKIIAYYFRVVHYNIKQAQQQ